MITENLQRRPVSAAMAESWLQRVRELLARYTRFTAQLTDALQQTVSHGLPFPDPCWYTESTALLAGQRQDLLEEIRRSAWMPESAGWDLPAADAPLQLIIDSLADLQQVSTELQRQQAELLPRYLELATTAARLTSRDEAVMPHLEPLRQQARRFQQQLELQPWVVAERDVQGQMEAFNRCFCCWQNPSVRSRCSPHRAARDWRLLRSSGTSARWSRDGGGGWHWPPSAD